MGVQFDSGSFTASGGGFPPKLTEFTLDRTVDIVVGLQVEENSGSFLLYLVKPQSTGPALLVQGSAPIDVAGLSIEVRFSAVPDGYYQIVVIPLGSTTVAGTFKARWEEVLPLRLTQDPQFQNLEVVPQDYDGPVVQWVAVDPTEAGQAEPGKAARGAALSARYPDVGMMLSSTKNVALTGKKSRHDCPGEIFHDFYYDADGAWHTVTSVWFPCDNTLEILCDAIVPS
ncbi:hypothetical protein [Nocardia asteroides]|uniref:hypothetical protein n=1 Tax=Nocardia asteroides TaxID=1824 RepID=UPI001E5B77DC|nr:hypothetical protein [Nocardia asteroides]UGT55183.1 hypothetical protein LTT85_32155 [Nocardia asteroides]